MIVQSSEANLEWQILGELEMQSFREERVDLENQRDRL